MFFVDHLDPRTFDALWTAVGDVQIDIVIDDGLPRSRRRITFEKSLPKVRSGGLYVIEDVPREQLATYLAMVADDGLPGISIDIVHPVNRCDNFLVVAVAR